jgi:hypothetical protein
MPRLPWLERFAAALHHQPLPLEFKQRLLDELHDHFADLEEEIQMQNQSMQVIEERLGSPEDIATLAATEYHRLGFLRRHPWVLFAFGPMPVVVLSFLVYVAMAAGLAYLLGVAQEMDNRQPGQLMSDHAAWWIELLHQGSRFVPFVLSAGFFAWLSWRYRPHAGWAVAAFAVVTLVAGAFHSALTLPTAEVGGSWMFGLGIGLSPSQLLQMTLPLAVGLLALWLARRPIRMVQ